MRKVIFVDWFSTLALASIWRTLCADTSHPLSEPVARAWKAILADNERLRPWMLGRLSTREIIASMAPDLGGLDEATTAWLEAEADLDLCTTPLCQPLVEALRQAASTVDVVIATDNVDSFVRLWPRIALLLPGVTNTVLNSCEIGFLKEDPEMFFGPTLRARGITFADTILIDDSALNCERFREMGGQAICHSDPAQTVEMLEQWLMADDVTKMDQEEARPQERERPPSRITRNAARCLKCQDVIESTHRHDFVRCSCGNIAVDGGHSYLRRVGTMQDYEDLSTSEEMPVR